MPATVRCQCGNVYELKDEFAGRQVTCPECGAVSTAQGAPAPASVGDPAFDRDKFLLRQKAMAIKEKYYVWDEAGQTILYVERPRHMFRALVGLLVGLVAAAVVLVGLLALAGAAGEGALAAILALLGVVGAVVTLLAVAIALTPKRHVSFFRDDTKSERVLEVLQDRKFQVPTVTYTVRDRAGKVLAHLRKNYLYNLFRKQWRCLTPGGSVLCIAKEDSIILSLLRRFLGPFFGLLRTNFIILRGTSETVIGEFNRKFTLLDRYVLDLTRDPRRQLDRRVGLALGVMLDTGERR
jgi:uncharacterized protein YxjI